MFPSFSEIEDSFRTDKVPGYISPAPSGSPFVVFAEFKGDDASAFDRDDVVVLHRGMTASFGCIVSDAPSVRRLHRDVKAAFQSIDGLIARRAASRHPATA